MTTVAEGLPAVSIEDNLLTRTYQSLEQCAHYVQSNVTDPTVNAAKAAFDYAVYRPTVALKDLVVTVVEAVDPYARVVTGAAGAGLIAKGVFDKHHKEGNRKIADRELTGGALLASYPVARLAVSYLSSLFEETIEPMVEKAPTAWDTVGSYAYYLPHTTAGLIAICWLAKAAIRKFAAHP